MPIELHCPHCGKMVRAPDSAAGRRGKCPYCHQSVYIPTPVAPEDELPLAPLEDEPDEEERLVAQLERELLRETRVSAESPPEPTSPETALPDMPTATREAVETLIFDFIRAMSRSDLDRAEQIATELAESRDLALSVIEQLSMDAMPPSSLAELSPAVYQGFLRNLRNRL